MSFTIWRIPGVKRKSRSTVTTETILPTLHELLDNADEHRIAHIVSWNPGGQSWRIHNETDFEQDVLRRFFPRWSLRSFRCELSDLGIVPWEQSDGNTYQNPLFLRGKPQIWRTLAEGSASLPIGTIIKQKNSLPTIPFKASYGDSFRGENTGDSGATMLCELLQQETSVLCEFDLRFNQISDEGATSFAIGLKQNSWLKHLSLQSNKIGNIGACRIADALLENSTLETLVLAECPIGDEGAKAFANCLRHNATLRTLDLSTCPLGDEGAAELAKGLTHNSTLLTLDLSFSPIGTEGKAQLVIASRHNATLEIACEQANGADDDDEADEEERHGQTRTRPINFPNVQNFLMFDCGFAFRPLKVDSDEGRHRDTPNIQTVHMDYCELNDRRLERFSDALQRSSRTLQTLSLSSNQIGDDGATLLATILRHCLAIRLLDLSKNRIGDFGIDQIAAALADNNSLCELYVCCNAFGNQGAVHLATALQHKPLLSVLDLYGNAIGNKGATHIAQKLLLQTREQKDKGEISCPSLQILHLGANRMGDEGGMDIASALRQNTTLQQLYLKPNAVMGEDGIDAIRQVLYSWNSILEPVDIIFEELD